MTEFILVFIASYFWHSMGVTVGYHRLLSHRSFDCKKFVEYFFVLGGYLAFEGSPIWWSTIHRAHHRYVDTPLDPHSPRVSGVAYSYYGWMAEPAYAEHVNPGKQSKDLLSDPIYRFLEFNGDWKQAHTFTFLIGFLFRAILWLCFGWQVALASLLAAAAVLQIPLLLNVVCHIPKLGYKNYAAEDDSVNVWWVALLAMGEGWHNNHHAFPGSARSGMLPHELDLSWLTLKALKSIGWVGRLNEAKPKPVRLNVPTIAHATFAHAVSPNSVLPMVSRRQRAKKMKQIARVH